MYTHMCLTVATLSPPSHCLEYKCRTSSFLILVTEEFHEDVRWWTSLIEPLGPTTKRNSNL